jgi:ribosomal protein L39E
VSKEYEPPFGHAEELSLKSFTKKMNIDLNKALSELKDKGITVESEKDSLAKIAKENRTSPMHLYVMIKKFESKKETATKDLYTAEMIEEQFSGTGLVNLQVYKGGDNIIFNRRKRKRWRR